MNDPYQILGVRKDASADDIKRAYHRLAKKLHPDLNPGNATVERQFKDVTAAYDVLSDPTKRAKHDQGERHPFGAGFGAGGFGRNGFGRGAERDAAGPGETMADDIFSELFGRRRRPGAGAQQTGPKRRGPDTNHTLLVTFLEAVQGARKRITLVGDKTMEVTVPPGTSDCQTLRLSGQGMPGTMGAPPGDAYIEVHVDPHPFFVRKDRDIHLELPVTIQEAVLGASVTVPTVDGRVSLKIPPGSNTGTVLRLKGKGVPDPKTRVPGDQYVTLRVVLPDNPDPELVAFLERWSRGRSYDPRADAGIL
jgi:DnaJ-class molecular chaperone